ncbi:MAG TPA: S-methyl-5'-thioadenosine phosphorylase [Oligoflexus sp.]|uniref:S-methyl-5'-thioadenosine phosphorylase n=1 Tax=Oligoflexus sp. TaxID=1971216 RepID=UPI002D2DAFD4|nr:S-methyl-5'-thioadenosine phosphorylase [Oligoflexus sp.]HYX31915.1 S-methyl-5'-thioadenosine phosphorylase [Oligoflexus sp.]
MAQVKVQLGVIGGSGVYQMAGVERVREHTIPTPFGDPSDVIVEAKIYSKTIYFLPRHGRGHRWLPSEVNYRANIYALKSLGVTHVLAVSAVGIMKDDIHPGDLVIPDQIFDRTKGIRPSTFFGGGIVGHVEFADPFCADFRGWIETAARKVSDQVYSGGTYVCIEGPQFSTRAESQHYRETIQPSVIGMTALPEAKLAREAEMAYGMLAMATDYDCWHQHEADVTVEAVLAVLKANTDKANRVIKELLNSLPDQHQSRIFEAAKHAIMTAPEMIPLQKKKDLALLYGTYLG